MLSEVYSAGNTGDAGSTDWRYLRVRSYCSYWVCHYSILPILLVYSQQHGFCTFIQLWVLRGYILRVLPILAVAWEDTSTIGNFLGLCSADILPLWATLFGRKYSTLRVLAALKYILNTPSILQVWPGLRWLSVHTAVCRLASVAVSSIQRTDHQLAASEEGGLALLFETVYISRSDCWGVLLGYKYTTVCRTDGDVSLIYAVFVFNQVRSRVWDESEKEAKKWSNEKESDE